MWRAYGRGQLGSVTLVFFGELDREGGACSAGREHNITVVSVDDGANDCGAQASAVALIEGDEGFKEATLNFAGDARAVV